MLQPEALKAFILVCSILHPAGYTPLPTMIYDSEMLDGMRAWGDYHIPTHDLILRESYPSPLLERLTLEHEMWHHVLTEMDVPGEYQHAIMKQYGAYVVKVESDPGPMSIDDLQKYKQNKPHAHKKSVNKKILTRHKH